MASAMTNQVSELDSTETQQQTAVPPQPAPVTVLRVATVESESERAQAPAVRISARVPAPEPPRNASSTVPPIPKSDNHQQALQPIQPIHPAATNGLNPVAFSSPPITTTRDPNFRVRTALTKGWRKGKKSRKSVGGGRGPGFTSREVDGLLDLLESTVPVTREEWESVRGQHAERFPGTSRSIDSIRRKFAKVYLARGTSITADGTAPPVVRRAKLIRERMASRAVSLDDEDAAMVQPEEEHLEAMEAGGSEMHEDEVMETAHHSNAARSVHSGETGTGSGVVAQTLEAQQAGLDDGNVAMLPAVVVPEPIATSSGTQTGGPIAPVVVGSEAGVVSPNQVRKQSMSGDKIGEAGNVVQDLVSIFKMYLVQQTQQREEDRRIREEERAEQRALEKARQEREDRRNEQFMQLMMLLAPRNQDNTSGNVSN